MKEKKIKNIIKICAFFTIVNLPFITITQLISINTFIDSFDNPKSYQYLKTSILEGNEDNGTYIVIQKASHQNFQIKKGDEIFYIHDEGGILCQKVYQTSERDPITKYYTYNFKGDINEEPIKEYQIIGKVVTTIEDNIWNTLSLKIWDMSINNLNAAALFTNN